MPSSICLHHCLWGDVTKFCGPFKSIYSSADSSLSPFVHLLHTLFPSFNPWTTICSPPSFHASFSSSSLFYLSHHYPSFAPSITVIFPSLPTFIYLLHSLYFSPPLFLPFPSISVAIPHFCRCVFLFLFHLPSCFPLSLSIFLSLCLPSLFYSPGEVDCNWFLPVTSQASPETETAPVKDYEADP